MIHDRSDKGGKKPAGGYAARFDVPDVPVHRLAAGEVPADAAYQLVHDALLLDGSSRLNLATFVTTWMEPQADRLMAEAFDKNSIDKDEYPATAELERRCVSIVADLFHAPDDAIGASTIGSSEAVMLAGMAMKWRWRAARRAAGAATDRPKLVMSSGVQVVWEKFCRYWDVEPRYVPVRDGRYVLDPDAALALVDENTIGVVAILGTTHTGEFEPVQQLDATLEALHRDRGWDVPIHVDAASGGFVAPFLDPDLLWDFRLPRVISINVSGHKYGLTYPGIGFVVWRHRADLAEDLIFRVSYLGGDMPTFTLNFSRPGNQIVGQYYNFLRLGRDGYTRIMRRLRATAMRLGEQIGSLPQFEIVSDGHELPVVAFRTTGASAFTVFDLSDELRRTGWQVPAYPMPDDAPDVSVLRIVVREGFSDELADALLADLRDAPFGPSADRGRAAHGLRSSRLTRTPLRRWSEARAIQFALTTCR